MDFTKMHGTGNDFICVNGFKEHIEHPDELAKVLCDRHFGIGADGLLLILPPNKNPLLEQADCRMELYNADGSRARMCGNGIRCLGKYVYVHGITKKTSLVVETLSGIRKLELQLHRDKMHTSSGRVEAVKVDMGSPRLNAHSIPILCERDIVIQEPVWIGDRVFSVTGVSMGNPHVVIFTDDLDIFPVSQTGQKLEFHPRFPERMNIEFCQIVDRTHIRVRVWERGVGETLACGTGACAAVCASVLNDKTDRNVNVFLPGGELQVAWEYPTNRVYLSGKAEQVFEGKINKKDK